MSYLGRDEDGFDWYLNMPPETQPTKGRNMNRTRNAIILVVAMVAIVGALFSASMTLAGAVSPTLSWDHNAGIFGPPGSTVELTGSSVDVTKVGQTCDVTVDIGNNDSIRTGSDITIRTGTDSHVFPNTEAVVGNPGPVTIQMVMGTFITADLKFSTEIETKNLAGYSGSGTITVGDCPVPPTTTVPPTTPVQPPAPVPPTPVTATPTVTG